MSALDRQHAEKISSATAYAQAEACMRKTFYALFFAMAISFFLTTVFAPPTFAQSIRASRATRLERIPESERRARAEAEERDIDEYLGRIVRKDDDVVIVKISRQQSLIDKRIRLYYAVDKMLRPIALLEDLNMSYNSCAAFKITDGNALLGDVVMVKSISPNSPKLREQKDDDAATPTFAKSANTNKSREIDKGLNEVAEQQNRDAKNIGAQQKK